MAEPAQQVQMKSRDFQPNKEYLLLELEKLETEKETAAGIIIPLSIPQGPAGRQTTGTVIKIGSDVECASIGDFVVFPNTDGIALDFEDGEFLLLRMASVLGTKIK